ncbi:MAG: protein-disulfide reductase DsbD domain-containing protein [Mesorhizobium sp.]
MIERHVCMIARGVRQRQISAMRIASLLLALPLAALPSLALAASSQWFETEGARIRLLTDDQPRADGTLRGTLSIELDPGWKTYWRDPGDSGVPPQIDISRSTNIAAARIEFPAPMRFETDGASWAGYQGTTVDLPVTFNLKDPARFAAIDADIFLGVCREVCIPVQAGFSVTPGAQGQADEEANIIATAFASLPPPSSDEMQITTFRPEGDDLIAEAVHPAGPGAQELYVVTPPGWQLGTPDPEKSGDRQIFRIPVQKRGAISGSGLKLDYVYRSGFRVVSGSASVD